MECCCHSSFAFMSVVGIVKAQWGNFCYTKRNITLCKTEIIDEWKIEQKRSSNFELFIFILSSTRAMQLNWDVRWCVLLWCPLIGTGLRTSSPAGKELMQIQSSLTEEEDVKAIATSRTKQNKASAMWELLLAKGTPKKISIIKSLNNPSSYSFHC